MLGLYGTVEKSLIVKWYICKIILKHQMIIGLWGVSSISGSPYLYEQYVLEVTYE